MARSVSLAMIVKDEAALLASCLASARPVADEICIVDTGSHDDTVDVARRFGARIDFFPWCNDFAAARNVSLGLCTGDWVLILDADERLASEDLPEIRRLAEGPLDRCYRLLTRNYTNTDSVGEFRRCAPDDAHAAGFPGWFPSWKVRLFPNRTGAQYEGAVHELVRPSLERSGLHVEQSRVVVHHYPALHGAERLDEKRRLYVTLGEAKVKARPTDAEAHAELGHQYAELGDYSRAAAAYRESLRCAPDRAATLKDLGGVLHLMGRSEEARKALRLAVRYDPGLAEAWRNLGVIHASQAQWNLASECFAEAVRRDPAWADGPRYLAVALEQDGRLSEALQAARQAVQAAPGSPEAVTLYAGLMARLPGSPAADTPG